MLYSTVNIKAAPDMESWEVYFQDVPHDREENQEALNGWGFYHYERTKSREEAFNTLRNYMIKCHREKIEQLTKSMKMLENLTMEKNYENN